MKAEEYLKVKNMMRWELSEQVTSIESRSPVKAVRIVENYVKANPEMTNAQKFEQVFGFPPDYPTQKEWWNDLYVPMEIVLS